MENTRTIIIGALAVVVLYVAVRFLVPERPAAPRATPRSTRVPEKTRPAPRRPATQTVEPPVTTRTSRPRSSSGEPFLSPRNDSQPAPVPAEAQAGESMKKPASAQARTPAVAGTAPARRSGKPPIQDLMARAALAFVGADPEAELYWYQAINDPGLGPQERQDLIEDLNEDGLSDPRRPTMDDLPLILNRIALIEEVVWDAMDEVNADAFLEAYKDLVNLAFQALENG